MMIFKTALPRRTVLRGLGATLGLPLLDSMVPAVSAIARTAARPVNRFGVVYVPNGMIMNSWMSTLLSAWAPPLMMFIMGTGSSRANAPPM